MIVIYSDLPQALLKPHSDSRILRADITRT